MALPDLTGAVTITAPASVDGRGGIAVLNDTASSDFVGYLLNTSGFDGPAVRTSMDNIVEGHGATFGSFYHGARSFTLEVVMAPAATWTTSNTRLDKLYRATNAMQADGTIIWTESGLTKRLDFRREQPPRGPDADRKVLVSCIAANPRIVSPFAETTTSLNATITNVGNAGYLPRFTLTTPSNPVITNTTTGQSFSLTLTGGAAVIVDFAAHTVTQSSVNRYSSVNFSTSTWWELIPGPNNITVTGATGQIHWRSAWL